ncbi:MAG: ABC transporter permease [bacterium]
MNVDQFFDNLGKKVVGFFENMGGFSIFFMKTNYHSFRFSFRYRQMIYHLEKIGVNSVPIITLSSFTIGMIFSLQLTHILRIFSAESLGGASVALAMAREGAPVMTALMLVGKNGSAMTAEIGSMKVTEQIDALKIMAVDPHSFLVTPRIVACMLSFPVLTAYANLIGLLGSYTVSTYLLGVDPAGFMGNVYFFVDPDDVYTGMIKAFVFGYIVALICCYFGFATEKGAKGVGKATTTAVVVASVAVLMADYVMADILLNLVILAY